MIEEQITGEWKTYTARSGKKARTKRLFDNSGYFCSVQLIDTSGNIYRAKSYKNEAEAHAAIREWLDVYSVSQFLDKHKGIINYKGISRMTGINKDQLSQYAIGYRNAGEDTAKAIEEAIHRLAEDLANITII